jgi:endonuclease G
MMGRDSALLAQIAGDRIAKNEAEIRQTLSNVEAGNPLASEQNGERLVTRLMAKNGLTREESEAAALGIRAFAFATMTDDQRSNLLKTTSGGGAEAIWGQSIDFIGVAFLERGRRAAQTVARVAFQGGRGLGSGFLVGQGLFLTNHHVIPEAAAARELCLEFDFELDLRDNPVGRTVFALDPDLVFLTDPVTGLDFTLVGVGERLAGVRDLASYGFCPLSDASDKHAIGEVVNIVQHPQGRYKEVVLRENRLVARAPEALHYVADTEPGSSGSPVFNNQWQPVALHHWGTPFRNLLDDKGQRVPREVNEGIRISRIVTAINAKTPELEPRSRDLIARAVLQWTRVKRAEEIYPDRPEERQTPSSRPRTNADGSMTWTFPLEITVRAPLLTPEPVEQATRPPAVPIAAEPSRLGLGGERALKPNSDYSDRGGYEIGFIPGHSVPLPRVTGSAPGKPAVNREARAGDDPHELKYHHFSAIVNADRHLTFVLGCNIDGRRSKYINREKGTVEPLDPVNPDHGLMERLELFPGAEASESWYDDRRHSGWVAGQDVYERQVVAGHLNTRSMGRTLRMFQRGHLVRRLDPAWGSEQEARLAEADTFHFTNCTPQVGFFNMGQGAPRQSGTGGGKLWRAVENLVLRNARTMRTRVSAFTGPIFSEEDREFRTIQVPGRFFKVAVWADEEGELRSLAMIADQRPVIDVWPEALFSSREESGEALGAEAFGDADELERVQDFLSTIEAVEAATGLDFGNEIRTADVRTGEQDVQPARLEEVPLTRQPRTRRRSGTRVEQSERPTRRTRSSTARRPSPSKGRADDEKS